MQHLTVSGLRSLTISRRNAMTRGGTLSVDQFGAMVQQWNALDYQARTDRHQYCQDKKHRYVHGPWPHFQVCVRCLESYQDE